MAQLPAPLEPLRGIDDGIDQNRKRHCQRSVDLERSIGVVDEVVRLMQQLVDRDG